MQSDVCVRERERERERKRGRQEGQTEIDTKKESGANHKTPQKRKKSLAEGKTSKPAPSRIMGEVRVMVMVALGSESAVTRTEASEARVSTA